LPALLTIDVGPDDAVLGAGRTDSAAWGRSEAGLAVLTDSLKRLEDELGAPVPATWFIRADEAIRRQLGSYDAVVRKCQELLHASFSRGHEAAWLVQPPCAELRSVHEALRAGGWLARSARAGELTHDNRSLAGFDALGIAFDSSALPGRARLEEGWGIDWRGTPERPYRPSVSDYRVPGEPSLAIWEIPLTTLAIRAPYDAHPVARYVNPCMRGALLWPALEHVIADASYLLCVMHPDEAIARQDRGHPLIAYSADNLRANLRRIVRSCVDSGRGVSFTTVADFGARLDAARA
jgi:hypothetical protein